MSQLRKDPFVDRWVIIAEERGRRPAAIQATESRSDPASCPFCAGNESETEPEIFALRADGSAANTPGWSVRVVPNRYPALRPDAAAFTSEPPLRIGQAGIGHHEVIIEGVHTRSVSEIPEETYRDVVAVYRERYRVLKADPQLRSAVLIKNVGTAAGASIEHSHSQLIATPVVPPTLSKELDSAVAWHTAAGSCLWCHWLDDERQRQERVIAIEEHFALICPYAPRFPYETWIVPLSHRSHFEDANDEEMQELAVCLRRTVAAIERLLGTPAYNYVVHSAPLNEAPRPDYHWRVEVLPRVTRVAGYEQATGLYINPMPPERSAEDLRDVW